MPKGVFLPYIGARGKSEEERSPDCLTPRSGRKGSMERGITNSWLQEKKRVWDQRKRSTAEGNFFLRQARSHCQPGKGDARKQQTSLIKTAVDLSTGEEKRKRQLVVGV